MKKTKLIVENTYDFDLLGVIASIKFYKLAWFINKQLKVRLRQKEDLRLEMKVNSPSVFGNYLFESTNNSMWLFKNKSLDGEPAYLIPELQHFDYLIKLDKDSQSFASEEILKELKEVLWIEYIAAIEINNLKSKDNLLT